MNTSASVVFIRAWMHQRQLGRLPDALGTPVMVVGLVQLSSVGTYYVPDFQRDSFGGTLASSSSKRYSRAMFGALQPEHRWVDERGVLLSVRSALERTNMEPYLYMQVWRWFRYDTTAHKESSSIMVIRGASTTGMWAVSVVGSSLESGVDSAGTGPTSPSSSSSLSSPGRLNTSSFPLMSRRFLRGTSGTSPEAPAPSLPSFSAPFPFARPFFFSRFARFFAVFASASASRSRRFRSNSAVSAS